MQRMKNIKIWIGLAYLILLFGFLYFLFSKFSIEEITTYNFIRQNREYLLNLREANIISPIINKLTYIRKIIYLFYIKFLYERAEGIVFVSKGSMLDFDKHISSKKIVKTHIPNPVFENKSLDTNCDIHNFLKDKKFILAVGRIHEQKNFSTLLDIFFG